MGRIRHVSTGLLVELDEVHPFGRAPPGGTAIEDASVSRVHALLAWTDGCWTVVDLGSRNGTTVGGMALAHQERRALLPGDVIRFGRGAPWRMESTRPPEPRARTLDGEVEVVGDDGILFLPASTAPEGGVPPEIVIRRAPEGWLARDDARAWGVADADVVEAGGRAWRLRLPGGVGPTCQEGLSGWRLEIGLPDDDDRVSARICHGTDVYDLGHRAHHRLLVPLVRERARSVRRRVPDNEAGWLRAEDVAAALRIREQLVYLHAWRLRAQLDALGVPPALTVIERRLTGEMRVGTPDAHLGPLR